MFAKARQNYELFSLDKAHPKLAGKEYFYIIEHGKIEMKIDNNDYIITKKNTISSKALIKHCKKTCSLTVKSKKVYLYQLPLEEYTKIFLEYIEKKEDEKIQIIKQISFLSFLDKDAMLYLSKNSKVEKYPQQKEIIKEGDTTDCLFCVLKGEVECHNKSNNVRTFTIGKYFGDVALFTQAHSANSYYTKEGTELLLIEYKTIQQVFNGDANPKKLIKLVFNQSLNNSKILKKYANNGYYLTYLFKLFNIKYYHNESIASIKNKKLFIPIAGTVYKKGKKDVLITKGEMCGEDLLEEIDSVNVEGTTIYGEEAITFEVDWTELLKGLNTTDSGTKSVESTSSSMFIVPQISKTMYETMCMLKRIPYINGVNQMILYQLAENIKTITFRECELIIRDGPISDKLYFILQGKVSLIIGDIEVKTLEQPSSFGDISQQPDAYGQKASFYAKTNLICFCLDKDTYEEILDCEIVKKSNNNLKMKNSQLTLDQLYYLKLLGKGSYGNVYLVHDKKRLYALKEADIKELSKNSDNIKYYKAEKDIMIMLNHPFIVQFVSSFKTKDFLFFLLEFIDGISLRDYITNEKTQKMCLRNNTFITFTAAILCSIVNYLQRKKIIHRDFKPENLMINSDGYIKTVDFGVAKDLSTKDSTNTYIGTIHYMAPEMLMGNHYSFGIDVWAIGIILYEIFYGKLPFGVGMKEPNEVLSDIKEGNLILPSDPKNTGINELLKKLLDKKPSFRLNYFMRWKNSELFNDFNFTALMNYEMKSPIEICAESFKEKLNDISCPFNHYIKNNIFLSSKNLDDILSNQVNVNDCLNDF